MAYQSMFPDQQLPGGISANHHLYIIHDEDQKRYTETIFQVKTEKREEIANHPFDLPYILYFWVLANLFFRPLISF